ncbi:MAG: threonine synthase [Eubacteriales bacterium]|nr:threonine synthase [Eubacteriales bacterium]
MKFVSTRDKSAREYNSYEVIKNGIAPDGGLFFPKENVCFSKDDLASLKDKSYAERAAAVISKYLTDFAPEALLYSCKAAYSKEKFSKTPAPLKEAGGKTYLELYHGPTCAFKDVALQLMPRLLSLSIEKSGVTGDALILVATSGDTGKAALEGFADVPRTKIMVFYPEGGVSDIQKKQMLTQKGKNVSVCGVKGNFDDCQTGVKNIFGSDNITAQLKNTGYFFSSANSINFGRLVPQVVYYISACIDMKLDDGKSCDITVPTGNFGNILAAYMAKKAGAPINRLICASNKNKVLNDFFTTGIYDRRREFYLTSSPSMDILVSSNLERLLWLVCGPVKTALYMKNLKENGIFEVDADVLKILREDFSAFYTDEKNCNLTIRKNYEEFGYLMDTHTAVGAYAADMYKKETASENPMIVVSTASPFKFSPAVCRALGLSCGEGFEAMDRLSEYTRLEIPDSLRGLRTEKDRFYKTVNPESMYAEALEFAISAK